MPLAETGHQERMREIESILTDSPDLHLAGNAYCGIGFPDCIKTGQDAAAHITS